MSKVAIFHQREFKGHKQSVYCVISDGHSGFFTAGSDGFIVHWEDPNSDDGVVFARVPEAVFSMYYDLPADRILAGGQYGNVYILQKNQSPKIVKIHEGSVFWVGAGQGFYLSCSEKGDVAAWDSQGTIKKRIKLSTQSLRWGNKVGDNWWFTGSEGRMWELTIDLDLRASHRLGDASWFKLVHTPDWVFAVGRDAKLHRWNHLFLDHNIQDAHWYSIHGLALSPDLRILATGSMDKSIRLWDVKTLEPLGSIFPDHENGHKSSVNDILWLDTEIFISVSDDASVRCWKLMVAK